MIQFTKIHLDYAGVKWTVKAKSKEESRYGLFNVLSTGKRIVATDGHRMHIYKLQTEEIPKGIYEVIEAKGMIIFNLTNKQISEFPDWMAVIPRHKRAITIKVMGNPKEDNVEAVATLFRAMPEDRVVNLKYLSDALGDGDIWKVNVDKEANDALLFRNGRKVAVVMPMRLK